LQGFSFFLWGVFESKESPPEKLHLSMKETIHHSHGDLSKIPLSTAWIFPLYFQRHCQPEETRFSKGELLRRKVSARLYWDLPTSGRY
jgi:hypothetical protein